MMLLISENKQIQDIQHDFTACYPFLRLDFYRWQSNPAGRKHLSRATSLKAAGLKHDGTLSLSDEMTVAELENKFLDTFGLDVQVSRKSGTFWLETTMTDGWTLQKQNDHGREISQVTGSSSRSRPDEKNQ